MKDYIDPEKESRREYIRRLHRTIRSCNLKFGSLFQHFTANIKERARAVLAANGGRTHY